MEVQAEKPEAYDFATVGRYAVLGSTVFPCFLFYWYKFLDARLVGTAAEDDCAEGDGRSKRDSAAHPHHLLRGHEPHGGQGGHLRRMQGKVYSDI